jgi:hypothetical protein
MKDRNLKDARRTVLLASAIHWPVASRMAMRFFQAGCRVAALYPSKAHPLACTESVESHHHLSVAHPQDSVMLALRESGADIIVPCDDFVVRHLHALHALLPGTSDGQQNARIIERSLGDPAAYGLLASRHAVQTAARTEGLNAAESFAIDMPSDLDTLAQSLPFPWVMKADHTWGGAGVRFVHSMEEARQFVQRAGTPPRFARALRQHLVKGERAAIGEWLHGLQAALSVQAVVPGLPANTVAACWQGEVLALISVKVLTATGDTGPAALVQFIENKQMEFTVRQMADSLRLSGFHGFDFMLDSETGQASLIEINPRCAPPSHMNLGEGRDLVEAFCRSWLGVTVAQHAPAFPGKRLAYSPQAWVADPSDPILSTSDYDIPEQDQRFVNRMMRIARRDRHILILKALLGAK